MFKPKPRGRAGESTKTCSQKCAAPARQALIATLAIPRVCECGVTFTGAHNRRHCVLCSVAKRRDHYRRKNRTRIGYTAAVRAFPINVLGDRDRWTCHLCGEGVDPRLANRHPGMASYDHLVPTSVGGSDEPENLKLAHLVCNVRRGAKLLTGQS